MAARRLLIVVNNPAFFLSHRLPVALEAHRRGWDVHVASPARPADAVAEIQAHGLRHHAFVLSRSGTNVFKELWSLVSLFRLYRSLRPDVVHHVTVKPLLYGGLAAWLAGARAVVAAVSGLGYVFTGDTPRHRLLRMLVLPLYRAALGHPSVRVIFQNPDDLALLERLGVVSAKGSVMIRGSGVPLDEFHPGGGHLSDVPVVVLPARMLRDKGVVEFVEAARLLRERGHQARFVLVGGLDPANPAALTQDTLARWCREGIVEWWGHRDDMATVLRDCRLVVLPSYREGLPRALLEAAASGRAIIASDVPGCREIVRSGENGLLVPARDSVALADAIGTLIDDPRRCLEMGRKGRLIAESEFSVNEVVDRHLDVYERLLGG